MNTSDVGAFPRGESAERRRRWKKITEVLKKLPPKGNSRGTTATVAQDFSQLLFVQVKRSPAAEVLGRWQTQKGAHRSQMPLPLANSALSDGAPPMCLRLAYDTAPMTLLVLLCCAACDNSNSNSTCERATGQGLRAGRTRAPHRLTTCRSSFRQVLATESWLSLDRVIIGTALFVHLI